MREAKTDWYCNGCGCCVEVTADESCESCGNKAIYIRFHIAVPVSFVRNVIDMAENDEAAHIEQARDILKIID